MFSGRYDNWYLNEFEVILPFFIQPRFKQYPLKYRINAPFVIIRNFKMFRPTHRLELIPVSHTVQKIKFSVKDFFSKCGHIYWRNS